MNTVRCSRVEAITIFGRPTDRRNLKSDQNAYLHLVSVRCGVTRDRSSYNAQRKERVAAAALVHGACTHRPGKSPASAAAYGWRERCSPVNARCVQPVFLPCCSCCGSPVCVHTALHCTACAFAARAVAVRPTFFSFFSFSFLLILHFIFFARCLHAEGPGIFGVLRNTFYRDENKIFRSYGLATLFQIRFTRGFQIILLPHSLIVIFSLKLLIF